MKAMVIDKIGGPEVFKQAEREKPQVKPRHVLIEVKATSVNPLDIKLRSLKTPLSENLPEILHGDVAGIITEIGPGVTSFTVGDSVYGCAGGIAGINGALAEYMLADTRLIAKSPKRLSFKQAAALPLVAITAWEGLVDKANLKQDETVLIHGGTGGVGHVAVQIAKHCGARVYATCSAQKMEKARKLGADHAIDYKSQAVADYVQEHTQGCGFDLVFDTLGGDNSAKSFAAARYNGAVISLLPVSDALPIALKGLSLHSVYQPIPLFYNVGRAHHGWILERIAEIVDNNNLTVLLDETNFSLWEVTKAHERLASGKATGKVVLTR